MSAEQLITNHLDLWTSAVTYQSGRGAGKGRELSGIKKLRELILELAVSGKLVEQDPNDEPASVLLEKIAEEKIRLVEKGIIKKTKELTEVEEQEKKYEIQAGWEWVRLGKVGIISSSSRVHQTDWKSSGIPFYRAREIVQLAANGTTNNELFISNELYSSLTKTGLTPEPHDIMVTGVGTIGVPYIVKEQDRFYYKDASVLIFKNTSKIYPFYLHRFLTSKLWIDAIHKQSMGTTVHTLTIARANNIPVPFPPLSEQYRIVAKVDELMALCDRLEEKTGDQLDAHEVLVDTLLDALTRAENADEVAAQWARLAEHFNTLFTTEASIDKLKQAILQLAVMGRLVEQDPNDEPTSVLLEKIAEEKVRLISEGVIKKPKQLWGAAQDELPQIPKPWSWVALGSLVTVMDAGWSPACPPEPAQEGDWGVLKTTAIQMMSYRSHENKRLPESKKPKEQYEVKSGDILITRAGPKNRVGVSCWVDNTREKLMISDKIIRCHLFDVEISAPFIVLCLNAGLTSKHLERAKSGMAESQMNISQDKLKAAPIPLCPTNEQHRIIAKVDELMALCDQLKARLSDAGETRSHLAEAVVEQAVN